ncbi:MAG: recombinase family protein [bacterium]|nr:recombinase family protein [bacterium]
MKTPRVATYARVSTEEQASEEATSLDEQQKKTDAYAISKDAEVVDRFTDDVSGSISLADRPGGAELLSAARSGQFDLVVVAKLDRFSRNLVAGTADLQKLKSHGIGVVFLDFGVDTSTPTGELMLSVMLAFADFERKRIRERMTDGRAGRARLGKWSGGRPPYGYRIGAEGRLELDPDEAPVVEHIFALAAAGRTPYQIAEILTDGGTRARTRNRKVNGRPEPHSPAFTHGTVKGILQRDAYKDLGDGDGPGILKHHRVEYEYRTDDNGEFILDSERQRIRDQVPGSGEPFTIPAPSIVPADTWKKANNALQKRARVRRSNPPTQVWTTKNGRKIRGRGYGLAGRIVHEHADGFVSMTGEPRKGIRRYVCSANETCSGFGPAPRGGSTIKSLVASEVDAVALYHLLDVLEDEERLGKLAAEYVARLDDEDKVAETSETLAERVDRLDTGRKRLAQEVIRFGLSDQEAETMRAEHESKLADARHALDLALDRERRREVVTHTVESLVEAISAIDWENVKVEPVTTGELPLPKAGTVLDVQEFHRVSTILKEAARDVARAEKRYGLRHAELRTEAVEWLRAIVESLDLVLVIRGADPTGWDLVPASEAPRATRGTSAVSVRRSSKPRRRSKPLLGGRSTPSSIRSSLTVSPSQIGSSSQRTCRSGVPIQQATLSRAETCSASPRTSITCKTLGSPPSI